MPAFNFQKQFADDIEKGIKHQTIRAKRKNKPKVGQTAHLFTDMRTSECRCLGRHPITKVYDIEVSNKCLKIDGVNMLPIYTNKLAREDGFMDRKHMLEWFHTTYGLPFTGDLVIWDTKQPVPHTERSETA